jgi:hypothetical protein
MVTSFQDMHKRQMIAQVVNLGARGPRAGVGVVEGRWTPVECRPRARGAPGRRAARAAAAQRRARRRRRCRRCNGAPPAATPVPTAPPARRLPRPRRPRRHVGAGDLEDAHARHRQRVARRRRAQRQHGAGLPPRGHPLPQPRQGACAHRRDRGVQPGRAGHPDRAPRHQGARARRRRRPPRHPHQGAPWEGAGAEWRWGGAAAGGAAAGQGWGGAAEWSVRRPRRQLWLRSSRV